MSPEEIKSIEDLFAVLDEYLQTPRRPPLTGAQHNVIAKMMLRYSKKLVPISSVQTITVAQEDLATFFGGIFHFSFWIVDVNALGYDSNDKSTWQLKPVIPDGTVNLNEAGNPVSYTFDFGYTIEHGFYQIN